MFNFSQLLNPFPSGTDMITFSIKVNGQPIPDNFAVTSIATNRCFNRIPYATICVLDSGVATQELAVSDQDILSPGNLIEISAGYSKTETVIFQGIIIRHKIKINAQQSPEIKIECKDEAVRLTVERKNKYFFDETDQRIIEAIIREDGTLGSTIADTNPEHPEMVQHHATDWDFIVTRAEANAHLVEARDGTVITHDPDFDAAPLLVLNYGTTIYEFEAEMDAREQYPTAKATSWDYTKQEVLAVEADENGASTITGGGFGSLPGAVQTVASVAAGAVGINLPGTPPNIDYRESLGVKQRLSQHTGKLSQPELENWAKAQYLKSRLAKQRGRVKFEGFGDLYPGDTIELQNVGLRHTGKVLVTAVRHEIQEGTWYTHAQFGLPQEWFLEAYPDVCAPIAGGLLPGIEGLQVGIVTRLAGDPDGEDRIQVRLPVLAEDGEGIWVRMAAMDAGQERGAFFRPEISDEVVVGFLNNDPRHGIVLGMLNSQDKPAALATTDDNHQKGWVTRSGIRFLFDDEKSSATLETPAGNQLLIDDDTQNITIKDQHGNSIVMDSNGITIKSAKDVNIEAQGDVNASGININHKAQAGFTAEASSTATLKSEAQTVIKGGIVQIN